VHDPWTAFELVYGAEQTWEGGRLQELWAAIFQASVMLQTTECHLLRSTNLALLVFRNADFYALL